MSPLNIALVQTALHWEDAASNLRMLEEKVLAIVGSPELIVLPEMFSTGFSMKPEKFAETMDGPSVSWMRKLAAKRRAAITGSLIIADNGAYYNRLVWMLPDGSIGHYDKRHLFAYAGEELHYAAGDRRLVASLKGWRVNLQVCYDLRFPVWGCQQTPEGGVQPEYDLLIYVANWPERRSLAWKTLLQARAIENQCYVAGVNRVGNDGNDIYHSGDSMIVGPLGEILIHSKDDESILSASLDQEALSDTRTRFPFWKDADHFHISR